MTSQDTKKWDAARAHIREQINAQSYDTWFSPIKMAALSDAGIVLEVPDLFFRDWVVERYMGLIEDALQKSFGKSISVTFSLPMHNLSVPNVRPSIARAKSGSLITENTGLNPKYTFDDFVIGPSNRFAHPPYACNRQCDLFFE